MKILVVSVIFPYPIDAGGSAGTFKLIDYSRKNHDITLVCPQPQKSQYDSELRNLWPDVTIITFETDLEPAQPGLLRKVYNLFRKKPELSFEEKNKKNMVLFTTDLVNCYFPELIGAVKAVCSDQKFDLIQVEFIEYAPIVYFLPQDTVKVFIHHEIRHRRMLHEYETLSGKDDTLLWKIGSVKKLEVGILNAYDSVFVLSDQDLKYLEEDGVDAGKLRVSPLPVEFKKAGINQPFVFRNRLIYLGPEIHYPNADAVEWFLHNCWAKLHRDNPLLEFWIVGKWSEECIQRYSDTPNVHFKGFVPDLEEVMEGSFMVVPLRIVSGMRMKILEAASWNVPVITTTYGAEGLPMIHHGNCLIADSGQEFIDNIEELISDPALQQKLVGASEELVSVKFSREYCGKVREQHYKALQLNP